MRISVPLTIVAALVLVSPLSAQIEPATLEVVDSNGQIVGPVQDFDPLADSATVPLLVDTHTILLQVRWDSIGSPYPFDQRVVYFESANCSGQGYILEWSSRMIDPYAIVGTNSSLWVGTRDDVSRVADIKSFRAPHTAVCSAGAIGSLNPLAPVSYVRDLSDYAPPFAIRGAAVQAAAMSVPAVSFPGLVLMALVIALVSTRLLRAGG